uniref:Uncharacterized protein n=1 Tax=Skeletonema marinoi TaxID=267567 RepID=A0A7S2P3K3_9STRA
MACCSKHICIGCGYANSKREVEENLEPKCPYCREKVPTTKKQIKTHLMRRIKVNDPVALRQMGSLCFHDGDYSGAFEYWIKAAGLGEVGAHFELSCLYRDGQGVEKDRKKQMYHLEEAAIGGDPVARNNLGCVLGRSFWDADSMGRAVKHFIIAANLGDDESIQQLKKCYKYGDVSKDDFAAALRAHQAAVDATKSPQREAAKDNA